MEVYWLNTNTNRQGHRKVHTNGCWKRPNRGNKTYLGEHATCDTAVEWARELQDIPVSGCFHCSLKCYTRWPEN